MLQELEAKQHISQAESAGGARVSKRAMIANLFNVSTPSTPATAAPVATPPSRASADDEGKMGLAGLPPLLRRAVEQWETLRDGARSDVTLQDVMRMQVERLRAECDELRSDYEALFNERKVLQSMIKDGGGSGGDATQLALELAQAHDALAALQREHAQLQKQMEQERALQRAERHVGGAGGGEGEGVGSAGVDRARQPPPGSPDTNAAASSGGSNPFADGGQDEGERVFEDALGAGSPAEQELASEGEGAPGLHQAVGDAARSSGQVAPTPTSAHKRQIEAKAVYAALSDCPQTSFPREDSSCRSDGLEGGGSVGIEGGSGGVAAQADMSTPVPISNPFTDGQPFGCDSAAGLQEQASNASAAQSSGGEEEGRGERGEEAEMPRPGADSSGEAGEESAQGEEGEESAQGEAGEESAQGQAGEESAQREAGEESAQGQELLTAAQGGDACSNGDVAAADGAVEAAAAGEMSVVASVVLAGQDLAVQGQGGERGGAEEELAVRAPSNTTLNVFGIKLGKSDVPQSAGSEDSVASVPRTLETDESGPAAASTHDAHSASPKQPNPFGVKLKSAAKTNSERGGAGEQRSGGVEGGPAGTHLQKSVFKDFPKQGRTC